MTRAKTLRAAVKPTAEGHLYVIQFDNGTIHVGSTNDLTSRIDEHRRDAARFGLTIVNQWHSERMETVACWQRHLTSALGQMGRRCDAGHGYFQRLPWTMAVWQAERVRSLPREQCCCGTCVDPVPMRLTVNVESMIRFQPDLLDAEVRLECSARIYTLMSLDYWRGHEVEVEVGDQLEVLVEERPDLSISSYLNPATYRDSGRDGESPEKSWISAADSLPRRGQRHVSR